MMVKKIGDLLRLRQRGKSHLLRPLDTHQESGRTVTVGVRIAIVLLSAKTTFSIQPATSFYLI
jgi:hypothetical protein